MIMFRKDLTVLLVLVFLTPQLLAQHPPDDETRRQARRSVSVEVYERCKDSIVFLTYPMPKGGSSSLNEFFLMPDAKDDTGVGSGIVIHEAGYALTNAHLLSPISMQARLPDGKVCPVEVVARDARADLAVVKIQAGRPLKAAIFAANKDV